MKEDGIDNRLYSAHIDGLNSVDVKAEPLSFHSSLLLSHWFVLKAKAKKYFNRELVNVPGKHPQLTNTRKHAFSALQEGTISPFLEFKATFGHGASPERNTKKKKKAVTASQKQHPLFYFHS